MPRQTKPKDELLSINDAAERGIERLRRPVWGNQLDHLKIDIFSGRPGPWSHLYAPFNKECNGRDPVDIINIPGVNNISLDPSERAYVAYTGPASDSSEYKAAAAEYEGGLADSQGGRSR